MGYSIEISQRVLDQVSKSLRWYEKQESDLGSRLESAFHERIKQIQSNPEIFTEVEDNQRRAVLGSSFPFSIHFQVNKKSKKVLVVGFFHHSLNPDIVEQEIRLERFRRIREEQAVERLKQDGRSQGLEP